MSIKFACVDCFDEMKEVPLKNPLIKYLGDKALKNYIVRKFPNTMDEVTFADTAGFTIKIPLIKPLEAEDPGYIHEVIEVFNTLVRDENIRVLVLGEALLPYKHEFEGTVANRTSLGLFCISSLVGEAKKLIKKGAKELHYVLVDGPSTDSEYVLDHISENINGLTLVTDQPKRYEERLSEIYEESGLVIQMIGKNQKQNIKGDIIVNCSRSYEKEFYWYQEEAVVLDLNASKDDLYKTKIKRSDLKIIHGYTALYNDEVIEPDILLGVLLCEDRLIRNIYMGGYRYNLKDKIDKVMVRYPLEFKVKCY